MKLYSPAAAKASTVDYEAWYRRLKRELVRMEEGRDILKKAAAYFAKDVK
jgi:transposase